MQNFQSFLSKLMQGIAGTARGINSQQNQKIGMDMSDPRNNPGLLEQDPNFVGPPSYLSGETDSVKKLPAGWTRTPESEAQFARDMELMKELLRLPSRKPGMSPGSPKIKPGGGVSIMPNIKPGGGVSIMPNIKPGGGVPGGNNKIPTMPRPNNPKVIPISIGSSNLVNRPNSNSNGLKPGNPINRMVNYGEADVSPQTKQQVQANLNRYFGR